MLTLTFGASDAAPAHGVVAGALQHVAVDLEHQVGGLGHRQEGVRGEDPAHRVLPPHQCLVGGHGAVAEPADRLVVEEQGLGAHGLAQLVLEAEPAGGPLDQLGHEQGVPVPAVLLGPVERGVGVAQQLGRGDAGLGQGDADADRHGHVVGPGHRLGDLVDQPLGDLLGVGAGGQCLAQDDELVAAHPGRRVAVPDAGEQPLGGLDQHRVAGLVPAAVVHQLEVVEVAEQQRDRAAGHGGPGQGVGGLGQQGGPVGQPGELVVRRLVRERLVRLPLGADVLDHRDEVQRRADVSRASATVSWAHRGSPLRVRYRLTIR